MPSQSSAGGIGVLFATKEAFVERWLGMSSQSSAGRIGVLFAAEEAFGERR